MPIWAWVLFVLVGACFYSLHSISETLKKVERNMACIATILSDDKSAKKFARLVDSELHSTVALLRDIKENSWYIADHVREVRMEEFRKSTSAPNSDG